MNRPHGPFWSGLFRNRRGIASCVCIVLVVGWVSFLACWIHRCCWDHQFHDWKPGHVAGLGLLSGLHLWLTHLDARYPGPGANSGPSPS